MAGFQFGLLAALGIGAGACIILQQALVGELRTSLASPLWAVFISYLGGLLTMVLVLGLMREPWPSTEAMARAPWASWAAGVFGVLYIITAIVILPKLGSATTFGLIFAGQMLASLAVDHFGLFGLPRNPVDWTRLGGAALLGAGVLLLAR
jgi:transporter family-2 protein